jgi:hypothetical protein
VLVRLCPELPEHLPVLADPATLQVLLHPDLAAPGRRWEAIAYVQAVFPGVDPIVIEAAVQDCIDFERLAASTGLDAELDAADAGTVPLPIREPVVSAPTAARTAVLARPALPARTLPVIPPAAPARTGPRLRVRPAFAVVVLAALGVLAVVLVGAGAGPLPIRTTPDRNGPDAAPGDAGRGKQAGGSSPASAPAPAGGNPRNGRGTSEGNRRSATPSATPPAAAPPAGATAGPAGPGVPTATVAPTEPASTQTATSDPPVTTNPTTTPPSDPPVTETTLATSPAPDCTVEVTDVGLICPGQP